MSQIPLLPKECAKGRTWSTYGRFISCFTRVFKGLLHHHASSHHSHEYFPNKNIPLAIYMPMAGILKSFRGSQNSSFGKVIMKSNDSSLSHCFEHEVFGHGNKRIGELFFEDYFQNCSQYPHTTMLPKCYDAKRYKNVSESLELAKKCCYWHYPGCYASNAPHPLADLNHSHSLNSSQPWNVCREQSHCRNSFEGRTGLGVCPTGKRASPDSIYSRAQLYD